MRKLFDFLKGIAALSTAVLVLYTPIYFILNTGRDRVPFSIENYFTRLGLVLALIAMLLAGVVIAMGVIGLIITALGGSMGKSSGKGTISPSMKGPGFENAEIEGKTYEISPTMKGPGFKDIRKK